MASSITLDDHQIAIHVKGVLVLRQEVGYGFGVPVCIMAKQAKVLDAVLQVLVLREVITHHIGTIIASGGSLIFFACRLW